MGAAVGNGSLRGSGRRTRRSARRPMGDINVTPLVDVMLVLLIIFMVTAPMLTAGVEVDLPKTKASPVSGTDEPLEISVKSNGKIYLQRSSVELKSLASKLQAIAGENKEKRIFVRGDRRIDYGQVMQVVGEIHSAGYSRVALITDTQNLP